jgi:NRPS condensation-like uncharacterized protein
MLREMGSVEQMWVLWDEPHPLVVVATLKIRGHLSKEMLAEGLARLCRIHPLLKVAVAKRDKTMFFVHDETSQIPLRVIERSHDQQWVDVVNEELNSRFRLDQAPLVRVTYLASPSGCSEIVLSFHHSIVDGLGLIKLSEDLLKVCAEVSGNGPPIEATAKEIPPAIEHAFPRHLGKLSRLHKLSGYLAGEFVKEIRRSWGLRGKNNRLPAPLDRKSSLIQIPFSKEFTGELVRRCKTESTTVSAALCAAALWAAQKRLYHGQSLPLNCIVLVDLRSQLDLPSSVSYLASYVTIANILAALRSDQVFWDLARQIARDLHRDIVNNRLLVAATYARQYTQTHVSSDKRYAQVLLSNLGRISIQPHYRHIELEEVHVNVSNNAFLVDDQGEFAR